MIATLVGLTLFFLALHFAFAKFTQAPSDLAFRLARGAVSVLLTVIGFFAMIHYRAAARFIYVLDEPDKLALWLALVPVGHFLGDFMFLAYRAIVASDKPRKDLIVHHMLGLTCAAATFSYPIAGPEFLFVHTSELMPVTTGLSALGSYRRSPSLVRVGARLRLGTLLGWRVPVWIWMSVQMVVSIKLLNPSPQVEATYPYTAVFLLMILSLDMFWITQSVRTLRRMRAA